MSGAPLVEAIQVPEGNPGALEAAVRTFLGAADRAEGLARRAEREAAGLVPEGWLGVAAFAFRAAAGSAAADLSRAPEAFRTAAGALKTLAAEIQAAQEAARRAQAAAQDVNARSARLDARMAEAASAPKADPIELTALARQADLVSLEAMAVRSSAAEAVERARAAAQRAAAVFEQVAGMAPSIRRAYAAIRPGAPGGAYDPMGSLGRGDVARWYTLLVGANVCPTGPGGYGGVGGFIRGPDGLDYPLVAPRLMIDGHLYGGNDGPVYPWEDVSTLGGADPGWTELYRVEGTTRVADKPSGLERFFIAMAGTNPNLRPSLSPLSEGEYGLLGITAAGVPFISAGRPPPKPPVPEPDLPRTSSPTFVRVGGELVMVDRNAPETWNREIRRSGITPNRPAQNVGRAIGGLTLAENMAEGINLARMADDMGVAAYQVVFEANDDGRRRARLRVYQVAQDHATGVYLINPAHVYVGGDGKPAFENIRFTHAPEIRPAGEERSYVVLEPTEEEPGD